MNDYFKEVSKLKYKYGKILLRKKYNNKYDTLLRMFISFFKIDNSKKVYINNIKDQTTFIENINNLENKNLLVLSNKFKDKDRFNDNDKFSKILDLSLLLDVDNKKERKKKLNTKLRFNNIKSKEININYKRNIDYQKYDYQFLCSKLKNFR